MANKSSIKWDPSLSDEYEGHMIIIITTIMTVLVVLSTTTRIGIKLWSRTPFRTADYLIMGSLVSTPCTTQPLVVSLYRL